MSETDRSSSFIGILILVFFMVGVPSLIVREFSRDRSEDAAISVAGSLPSGSSRSEYVFSAPVVDKAGILSPKGHSYLSQRLAELDANTGIQIGVLLVADMGGEDIESFSLRHAESWKLGQKGVDNGALLVVAMKEHGVRIETGYGTEGVLTDAKCSRILRNVIVPAFRQGDYEKGVIDGIEAMITVMSGDESMIVEKEDSEDRDDSGIPVPVMVFIVLWVLAIMSGIFSTVRQHRRGIFFVPPVGGGFRSGSSGSFGGSSGGFGGSFSGGGGSFGGGGASSGW